MMAICILSLFISTHKQSIYQPNLIIYYLIIYIMYQNNSNPYDQGNNYNYNNDPINGQKLVENYQSDTLYGNARLNFIRRVYSILSVQLFFTVILIICSMYSSSFFQFQQDNYWLMWVCIALMLVTQIAILCCKAGRKSPYNFILLFLFTFSQGYLVSFICSATGKQSGNTIVLVAGIMTAGIVVACTVYAFVTKQDFTVKWGIIIVILITMLLFGLFALIFRNSSSFTILYDLYCAIGVILFGIYLIIDTQLIMGGKRFELSLDDYVAGALLLYIDIIQIFLYILRLLGKK